MRAKSKSNGRKWVLPTREGARVERGHRTLIDLLGSSFGGDRNEQALPEVIVDQWSGALLIRLHSDPNGLRPVIFALEQLGSAMVAKPLDLGRTG